MIKKNVLKSYLQKRLNFRVANFRFNYLRHFLNNFENSCAHLVANFLKFLKLPKHFKFACFSRMLWTKTKKIRHQKICNKMSTRIFKIDGEMPEIIEPKVGNPKNSTNQNLANLIRP